MQPDIDADLAEALEIAQRFHDGEECDGDANRLADLVTALDKSLYASGVIPRRWQKT